MEVPHMMPQDFPPSGFEQMAGLGAIQAFEARTATALDRVELELRELGLWALAEAARRELGPAVMPQVVTLTDRVAALTRELHADAHHNVRPLLASARHHRRRRP
jgi:hypothetical protein